nr:unnamed protein product [Digitaria exilis]
MWDQSRARPPPPRRRRSRGTARAPGTWHTNTRHISARLARIAFLASSSLSPAASEPPLSPAAVVLPGGFGLVCVVVFALARSLQRTLYVQLLDHSELCSVRQTDPGSQRTLYVQLLDHSELCSVRQTDPAAGPFGAGVVLGSTPPLSC